MKKTIIATSIIVLLGVSYTLSSWYTGEVIESEFANKLTDINYNVNEYTHSLDMDLPDVTIQYSDYNKGVFSTSFRLTLSTQETDKNTVLLDDTVIIYHGPFPWSEIKSGRFSPAMVSLVYQTTQNSNEKLWLAAGNKPFFTLNMLIDYSENINVVASNEALNYHDDDSTIDIQTTENQFFITKNKQSSTLKAEGDIGEISYYDKLTPSIQAKNIHFNGQLLEQDESDYKLEQVLNIEQLLFNTELNIENGTNAVMMNQLKLAIDITKNKTNELTGKAEATVGNVTYGQQQLGKGETTVSLKYSPNIETTVNTQKAAISLDKLLWQTQHGDLNASFLLDIASDYLEFNNLDEDNVILAEVKADLPIRTLGYINAQINNPNINQLSENEIENSIQFIQLFSNLFLAKSPIITLNTNTENTAENRILVDLYYSKEKNVARLKGKTLTLGQFWNAIYDNKLPQLAM